MKFDEILAARERIQDAVKRTPVRQSKDLNRRFDCEIYFKCEHLQEVRAFKARGAMNAVRSLSSEERKKGVLTHSSGNHAQALAFAAKKVGTQAYVVMPENAPALKVERTRALGAEVHFCAPTFEAREARAKELMDQTGATFLPPFDHPHIIAGQGTVCLELLEEVPDLDLILAPIGGGGLLSGTAIVARALAPQARVVGVEPAGADDAYRSFKAGSRQSLVNPQTMADGLRTTIGVLPFEIIKSQVDDIVTVEEDTIVQAMRLLWAEGFEVEPSSAVALAGLLEKKVKGKKVGVILSGGNVDPNLLPF